MVTTTYRDRNLTLQAVYGGSIYLRKKTGSNHYEILYNIEGNVFLFHNGLCVNEFPLTKATKHLLKTHQKIHHLIRKYRSLSGDPYESQKCWLAIVEKAGML